MYNRIKFHELLSTLVRIFISLSNTVYNTKKTCVCNDFVSKYDKKFNEFLHIITKIAYLFEVT